MPETGQHGCQYGQDATRCQPLGKGVASPVQYERPGILSSYP